MPHSKIGPAIHIYFEAWEKALAFPYKELGYLSIPIYLAMVIAVFWVTPRPPY